MRSEEQGAQLPGRWRGREPRNAGGLEQLRGPGWRTARTAGSQSCNCRGLASARDREGKAALSSGRERGSQHPTPTPETERTKQRRVRAPSLWPLATGPRDPARRATLTTASSTCGGDPGPSRCAWEAPRPGGRCQASPTCVMQAPPRANSTGKPTRALWTGPSPAALPAAPWLTPPPVSLVSGTRSPLFCRPESAASP